MQGQDVERASLARPVLFRDSAAEWVLAEVPGQSAVHESVLAVAEAGRSRFPQPRGSAA
jgi:hypothetical protein